MIAVSSIFVGKATGGGLPLDLAEVRRGLAVLADPDNGCLVMSVPAASPYVLKGSDLDGLVRVCDVINGGIAMYVMLNPVPFNQPLHGANGNAVTSDVIRRRQFLIEIDPIRPAGISATEEEKEAAREVAFKVLDHLGEQGWPAPIIIDSGNGIHLVFRCELENGKMVTAILRKMLQALNDLFTTATARVELDVHYAIQKTKVPGSWSCKGENTKERPWRQARLLSIPEAPEPVALEQIAAVAGIDLAAAQEKAAAGETKASAFVGRAPVEAKTPWATAALERECGRMACTPAGGWNAQLNKSAFAMGQLVGSGALEEEVVFQALLRAAQAAGCNNPHKDEKTIRGGIEAGKLEPRTAPERNGKHEPPQSAPAPPAGTRIIQFASEITPRKVAWLWPGRVPLGKLTTFAGVGGLGKTFVLCDITARVTCGNVWPDTPDGECAPEGKVLFVSGEDDKDDTIVPRLIECGANLARVVFLTTETEDQFRLADLKTLEAAIEQAGGDVRLVVIDPPTAFLGGVDDHRNAELRALLSPLKSFTSKHQVAMIFNTHVNKPQGTKVEAMMRVMGSVAWVNAVRAAHMFASDPEDRTRRFFVGMKMNLGPERKGLAYKISPLENGEAKVEWLGEIDTTADEAVNKETRQPRGKVAAEWLLEMFADREEITSDEVSAAGKAVGLSRNALLEGKDKLGIRAVKRALPGGHHMWYWVWRKVDRPQTVADKLDQQQRAAGEKEELAF